MRLLVTGVSGLIGRGVATAALAVGHDVVALGRRRPDDLPAGVAFHAADLTEADAARDAVRVIRPTHIVHAAWETRHPTYWNDPANLAWVVSAAAMAGAFAEVGGARFVQVGSCAEYDWTDSAQRRDHPATRYGKAKLAAFRAIEVAAHDAFAAVEARIFSVFGPGENPARFVPLICRTLAAGRIPALASGRPVRDLLHVDDAARALLACAADDAPTGTIDIGTGRGVALAEVARTLAAVAGATATGLGVLEDRPDDPASLVADAGPLRGTGWAPALTLRGGLERTYTWWQDRVREAA
jgi:nucleoside-diphosphate-sugar epimerase